MKNTFFGRLLLIILAACSKEKDPVNVVNHGVNMNFMDTTVSPREDFYRFVNGAWMDSVHIPADRGRWGSFDELRINTSKNTLNVLETAMEGGNYDGTTDKGKAAIYYSVCLLYTSDAADDLLCVDLGGR